MDELSQDCQKARRATARKASVHANALKREAALEVQLKAMQATYDAARLDSVQRGVALAAARKEEESLEQKRSERSARQPAWETEPTQQLPDQFLALYEETTCPKMKELLGECRKRLECKAEPPSQKVTQPDEYLDVCDMAVDEVNYDLLREALVRVAAGEDPVKRAAQQEDAGMRFVPHHARAVSHRASPYGNG